MLEPSGALRKGTSKFLLLSGASGIGTFLNEWREYPCLRCSRCILPFLYSDMSCQAPEIVTTASKGSDM